MEENHLFEKILTLAKEQTVYIAGGPVRDWLLGLFVKDIDLVIEKEAIKLAKNFADEMSLSFVLLDEGNEVARVVANELSFDFSSFRCGSKTIEGDLAQRDFTINAMAIPLYQLKDNFIFSSKGIALKSTPEILIDPYHGKIDLKNKIIRAIHLKNLIKDPLRMLRAFRFSAVLDFDIDKDVLNFVQKNHALISKVAFERIDYELDKIMESGEAARALKALYNYKILTTLIPELIDMDGVEQPGFHHLDVLGHLFEAVHTMDILIKNPCIRYENCQTIKSWLSKNEKKISWLKWAAFMHDFGKPAQKAQNKDGRVTFYEHDKKGAQMVKEIGKRLRWSKNKIQFISNLVRLHMRPFHLLNDLRRSGPTKRAMRRLLEHTGDDYPALFLLAMADSMAGCGPMKPKDLDRELSMLFDKIHNFYEKNLRPIKENPPLIRGTDIIELFHVEPGPLIGKALNAVRNAQVEGIVSNKKEAIEWLINKRDEIFNL